mgnify:CR=1 FL=1
MADLIDASKLGQAGGVVPSPVVRGNEVAQPIAGSGEREAKIGETIAAIGGAMGQVRDKIQARQDAIDHAISLGDFQGKLQETFIKMSQSEDFARPEVMTKYGEEVNNLARGIFDGFKGSAVGRDALAKDLIQGKVKALAQGSLYATELQQKRVIGLMDGGLNQVLKNVSMNPTAESLAGAQSTILGTLETLGATVPPQARLEWAKSAQRLVIQTAVQQNIKTGRFQQGLDLIEGPFGDALLPQELVRMRFSLEDARQQSQNQENAVFSNIGGKTEAAQRLRQQVKDGHLDPDIAETAIAEMFPKGSMAEAAYLRAENAGRTGSGNASQRMQTLVDAMQNWDKHTPAEQQKYGILFQQMSAPKIETRMNPITQQQETLTINANLPPDLVEHFRKNGYEPLGAPGSTAPPARPRQPTGQPATGGAPAGSMAPSQQQAPQSSTDTATPYRVQLDNAGNVVGSTGYPGQAEIEQYSELFESAKTPQEKQMYFAVLQNALAKITLGQPMAAPQGAPAAPGAPGTQAAAPVAPTVAPRRMRVEDVTKETPLVNIGDVYNGPVQRMLQIAAGNIPSIEPFTGPYQGLFAKIKDVRTAAKEVAKQYLETGDRTSGRNESTGAERSELLKEIDLSPEAFTSQAAFNGAVVSITGQLLRLRAQNSKRSSQTERRKQDEINRADDRNEAINNYIKVITGTTLEGGIAPVAILKGKDRATQERLYKEWLSTVPKGAYYLDPTDLQVIQNK